MAWGRRRAAEQDTAPKGRQAKALNALLAERLAAHLEGAIAEGGTATLPVEGLRVECEVADVGDSHGSTSAALFLRRLARVAPARLAARGAPAHERTQEVERITRELPADYRRCLTGWPVRAPAPATACWPPTHPATASSRSPTPAAGRRGCWARTRGGLDRCLALYARHGSGHSTFEWGALSLEAAR